LEGTSITGASAPTGTHGLVAAISDQTGMTPMAWGPNGITTNANGYGIGAGQMNTALIAATAGATSTAALLCVNYCANYDGSNPCTLPSESTFEAKIGYGGWYLPSITELNQMFITNTVQLQGQYWSSTEINSFQAWGGTASGNGQDNKLQSGAVRCIRQF